MTPTTLPMERLDRRDVLFLCACILISVASIAVVLELFDEAFPEASIDFRYDRDSSRKVAEKLLRDMKLAHSSHMHASQFQQDSAASIFLERTLGLEKANALMRRDVKVWYWHHRWFRPLDAEELSVSIAPTGELVAFEHTLPEDRPAPHAPPGIVRSLAEAFLARAGIAPEGLQLVSESERKLRGRSETLLTWESRSLHPAGAAYRYRVVMRGTRVASFRQGLKVPDQFLRDYAELRSRNEAAGDVDNFLFIPVILAALLFFIIRLRRGDIQLRFNIQVGFVSFILVSAVSFNSYPGWFADYDTRRSLSSFLTTQVVMTLLQAVSVALFLVVLTASGEAFYRQRFPQHLALPSLLRRSALRSRRVFKGIILGYTMVAAFMAYQVLFYVTATSFGAWSPAETPYDEILNTAFPWVAVLFGGLFPAVSEELLSRGFSIPLFEKLLRSLPAAIVVAGFLWGFGHAAYPNQPFYIRGVEVGIAGVVAGVILVRFGLLPLLVWHYTIDALYTSLLLFRSGNAYFIGSAAIATMIFAIPTLAGVFLYLRHGGFAPDVDLSNAAIGTAVEPDAPPEVEIMAPLPGPVRSSCGDAIRLVIVLALAIGLHLAAPPSLNDVSEYRIDENVATAIARRHVLQVEGRRPPQRAVPLAQGGFRRWDSESGREDGGTPTGYDVVAVEYLMAKAPDPVATVIAIQRRSIEAATWVVRFFEPMAKGEIFVEIDPRTSKVVGYHRYLSESAAGARLERPRAEQLARAAFRGYGVFEPDFLTKEALSFQQPARRDWLFHFDEKRPLAAGAIRRVTVRVAGESVTQFAKTITIPDGARRTLESQSFVDSLLLIAKTSGMIVLLGFAVFGYVTQLQKGRLRWRRALRATLLLSPLALGAMLLDTDSYLSSYRTSIQWPTFLVQTFTSAAGDLLLQFLSLFLAISAVHALLPFAGQLLTREGRRSGRSAVVSGLTVVAIAAILSAVPSLLDAYLPQTALVSPLTPDRALATSLPAAILLWQALLFTILGCGFLASIAAAIEVVPEGRRRLVECLLTAALAAALIRSSNDGPQLVAMIARVSAIAFFTWFSIRYVLNNNYLSYPVALLVSALGTGVAEMLRHHRTDLTAGAAMLLAIAGVVVIGLAAGSATRVVGQGEVEG